MLIDDTTQKLNYRPIRRPQADATGDAVCLVVVDSNGSYWERSIVEETILRPLAHFGIPYRLWDLARTHLTAETLRGCAAVLLAQNSLNASLSEEEVRLVVEAVRTGTGLVNFDFDLRACGGPLVELFGFDRINPNVYATNKVQIGHASHYITAMQQRSECHTLEKMVSAVIVESWRSDVSVLARGLLGKEQLIYSRHLVPGSAFVPGNHPILFAVQVGSGRAVQFAINMRLWLRGAFGHGREMDDLFWRSIVWAARKPLPAHMTPPFVCLSFDDCEGRTDFKFVEIAHRHGYVPLSLLNIGVVPERVFPKIQELVQTGKALFNSHTLDYYDLLCFNFGKGECSRAELDRRFARHDMFWDQVGVRPCETFRGHFLEQGVKALPYLKQRGIRFFNPPMILGLTKTDQAVSGGYWPHGQTNRMYDRVPDDPDLFGVASLSQRGREDFLGGCTTFANENPTNDVEKAARSAAFNIMCGLRPGFFGELLTHEQKFDALSLEEWDRVLSRTAELISEVETVFANHDTISRYMQSKYFTAISAAKTEGSSLRVRLAGCGAAPLRLSVFRNDNDGVRREYLDVDPFDGEAEVCLA